MIFRDVILMFPLRRVGAPVVLEEGALHRVELACPFWANDCSITLSPRAYSVPSPSSCVIITAAFTADVAVTGPCFEDLQRMLYPCIALIYEFGSPLAVVLIFFSEEVCHRS